MEVPLMRNATAPPVMPQKPHPGSKTQPRLRNPTPARKPHPDDIKFTLDRWANFANFTSRAPS